MNKTINVDGREIKLVCNALLPRLYRYHFGHDLILDMKAVQKHYKTTTTEDGQKITEIDEGADLSVFEQVAWIMLKAGGEDVGETILEWLEEISITDLYEIERECLQLWQESQRQTSRAKKKGGKQRA